MNFFTPVFNNQEGPRVATVAPLVQRKSSKKKKMRKFATKWYTILCILVKPIVRNRVQS